MINKSETFTVYNPAKEMTNITSIIVANILSFLLARAFILDGIMPFGIAFFGTALLNRFAVLSILLSMALGLVSIGGYSLSIKYLLAALLLLFVCRVLFRRKTLRRYQVSLITAVSIFGVALANVYTGGQLTLYNLFMLSFEALASGILVYIFDYAMSVVIGIDKRKLVSREEYICIAVTCAIAVSGIGRVYLGGVCVRTLVMSVLVLTSGYIGGPSVGSAAGVVFGVISGLATTSIAVIVGVFAFAGLLAGTFKELGRLGSALGFTIGSCILNYYIAGQMVTVISMPELLIGTFLFLVTPSGLINRFSSISSLDRTRIAEGPSYSERVRELTSIRLKEFSKVFGQLAATFENITFREGFRDSAGIDKLMDGICGRACNGCSLYRSCWDREFYTIYQSMFELISIAEENGFVEIEDIPGRLRVKCIRPQQLIDAVNYLYDLHKINYKWQVRMEDCRNMVSQQLEGISRVIEKLAAEVNADLDFNEIVEDNIRIELDKQGLQVSKITVLERADKKMEVFIEKKACYGCRECSKKILPFIAGATGRKFAREGYICKINDDRCVLRFVEAQKYKVASGVYSISKDNDQVSGDNYTFMELKSSKYLMALSDGMGSGPSASMESSAAINLLEQLLEVGYDHELAVKTINSILMLKSANDSFSTLDIALVDLYSGEARIIKIGAPPTYVKKDNQVREISMSSLPVGIVNNLDVQAKKITLSDGDIIVMLTDGVYEAAGIQDNGSWIEEKLAGFSSGNPQQIAEFLCNEALALYGGNARDDMTVLVSRVWES